MGKVMSGFIEPRLMLHLDYTDAELGKSAWFAGNEFTAADIQMSFPLEAAVARGGLDATRPRLTAFLDGGAEGTRRHDAKQPIEILRTIHSFDPVHRVCGARGGPARRGADPREGRSPSG